MKPDQDELRMKIAELIQQHRDLDTAIESLQSSAPADPLQLRRLKKQKLRLKDAIAKLENQLLPDIIA